MEQKSNAVRNWSASADKAAFSDSSTKLSESVNELRHSSELDENENKVKLNTTHGNATSRPADYSIGSNLVPRMKNLQLSQKPERLAGYVKAVVPPSGILVIQRAPGSEILDVGTVIFARKIDDDAKGYYEKIGFVSDIFGCVDEPMYALQLKERVDSEFLRLDSEVYYSREHASTRFISVERDGNDRYTVMYS